MFSLEEQQRMEEKRYRPKPPGRKPGTPNKFTRKMKEAMFAGAENSIHARDPRHPDAPGTLTQFRTTIANPAQYLQVLSKFIPQQINAQTETTVEIVYNSIDDVKRALEDAGMPLKPIFYTSIY